MGGAGSGRWTYHDKKRTIEECWRIGISDVARVIDLRNLGPASGSLRPIKPAPGKRMSPVRCVVEVGDGDTLLLRLSYETDDKEDLKHWVETVISLQNTQPNFGGVRWWFSCPYMVDGEECGRRVGKLYLLPGGRYFVCRRCLDLTYESCQKSHLYNGLFALVAGEASGETFEAVKRAFSHQSREARRRREEPSLNLSDAFDEIFGGPENR